MIIGRKRELQLLQKAYDSEKSELVIVYGRRRVGKTFLVRKAFAGNFDFYVTGLFKKPRKRQLENFANALAEYSGKDVDVPKDWYEAYRMLKAYLKTLGERKKLVFIDEMPWMSTAKSDFVGALESFWNGWGSGVDTLKLIVCGSASSWFSDNVFSNKGGLFNRDTERIYLKPFTLHETELFLHNAGIVMNRYEITECYMIMGGIPYYLDKLDKSLSLAQNVDRLFFQPKALLFDEFYHLYDALFSKSENYIKIVEALAHKRSGLTQSEILKITDIPQNGNFGKMLDNLAYSNIIEKMGSYGEDKKEDRYLLCDFFTQFYFSFIKNNESNDSDYWTNRLDDPSHNVWRGLTFERICLQHLAEIKKALGIHGVATSTYTFNQKANTCGGNGAQIDLVIDRRDQVVNLCEAKFSKQEFLITNSYLTDLQNKVSAYQAFTSTKKALHLTMLTTYGLKHSKNNAAVQSVITIDDLFKE